MIGGLRRSIRWLCLGLFSLIAGTAITWGCVFCSPFEGTTLLTELDDAEVAFLVEIVELPPKDSGFDAVDLFNPAPRRGKTKVRVQTILKGEGSPKAPELGQTITVPAKFSGDVGALELVTYVKSERRWTTFPLNEESQLFVTGAAQLPLRSGSELSQSDVIRRLRFCLPYLGAEDFLLRKAVFAEFESAPFEALLGLGGDLDRESVLNWLELAGESAAQTRQMYLLLSLCGNESDLVLLEKQFDKCLDSGWSGTLDAILLAYATIGGEAALDAIDEKLLSQESADGPQVVAAADALKFLIDFVPLEDGVRGRVLESCNLLLSRTDSAGLVLQDLARWGDWSGLPRVLALSQKSLGPELNQKVRTYLELCPDPAALSALGDGNGAGDDWITWGEIVESRDKTIRLHGYQLPLKTENGMVTEFLLVPWVGACIHTPPPPPSQIVHVIAESGVPKRDAFDPVWIRGKLTYESKEHLLYLVDGSANISVDHSLRLDSMGEHVENRDFAKMLVGSIEVEGNWFARMNAKLSMVFTDAMSGIRGKQTLGAFGWALLVCFLYGILHTLGPGHGKAVIIAYFTGEGGSMSRGFRMGIQIAVFHVLSAVIIVLATDVALRSTTGGGLSDYAMVRRISYGAIIVIGSIMLWTAVRAWRLRDREGHSHHHEHSHTGCAACSSHAGEGSKSKMNWLSLAVGSIPCTGALLVLLFGIANDALASAVFLVVAISLGMAVALIAIGIAAIGGRRFAFRVLPEKMQANLPLTMRLVGSSAVLVIGILLFSFSGT